MEFNKDMQGGKIMAMLIAEDGTPTEIKILKGWREVHIPKVTAPVRFYTSETKYFSDHEYTVYLRDPKSKEEFFWEKIGVHIVDTVKEEIPFEPFLGGVMSDEPSFTIKESFAPIVTGVFEERLSKEDESASKEIEKIISTNKLETLAPANKGPKQIRLF